MKQFRRVVTGLAIAVTVFCLAVSLHHLFTFERSPQREQKAHLTALARLTFPVELVPGLFIDVFVNH